MIQDKDLEALKEEKKLRIEWLDWGELIVSEGKLRKWSDNSIWLYGKKKISRARVYLEGISIKRGKKWVKAIEKEDKGEDNND